MVLIKMKEPIERVTEAGDEDIYCSWHIHRYLNARKAEPQYEGNGRDWCYLERGVRCHRSEAPWEQWSYSEDGPNIVHYGRKLSMATVAQGRMLDECREYRMKADRTRQFFYRCRAAMLEGLRRADT